MARDPATVGTLNAQGLTGQIAGTITDSGGLTATSSMTVTVSQTLTSIAVTPGTASVGAPVGPGALNPFDASEASAVA